MSEGDLNVATPTTAPCYPVCWYAGRCTPSSIGVPEVEYYEVDTFLRLNELLYRITFWYRFGLGWAVIKGRPLS